MLAQQSAIGQNQTLQCAHPQGTQTQRYKIEKRMKYDDASWHVGGEFPKELPPQAGATHIGMFAAWCMLAGLAGELHEV